VAWEENSRPPSDVRVSSIQNVAKVSGCAILGGGYNWPLRKLVYQHKVGDSLVVKEVRTQALE
jgi:hypothetical protein